jgi:hypothetical protein
MTDSILGMLFIFAIRLSFWSRGFWGLRFGFMANAIPRVEICSLWTGWVSQRRLLFHSCREAKTRFAEMGEMKVNMNP